MPEIVFEDNSFDMSDEALVGLIERNFNQIMNRANKEVKKKAGDSLWEIAMNTSIALTEEMLRQAVELKTKLEDEEIYREMELGSPLNDGETSNKNSEGSGPPPA